MRPTNKKSYQTVIEFIKSDDYTQGALYVTLPHRRGAARARSLWPARAPMELNASGMAARTDAAGEPILLLDQNRTLWDQLQIRRGT